MRYETLHEVEDQNKVAVIAASLEANGWQGTPVVVFEDIQITGVHRAAAAQMAGVEMEIIELEDIFTEDGANWDAALAACEEEPSGYIGNSISAMLPYLSDGIKTAYGIDLH